MKRHIEMTQPGLDLSAFEKLRQNYKKRLRDTMHTIDSFSREIKNELPTQNQLEQIKILAHGMAGTGGTFGYPNITITGRKLDEYIGEGHIDASLLKKLLQELRDACDQGAQEDGKTHSTPSQNDSSMDGKPFILVVDDDKEMADFVSMHFAARGLEIKVASDGAMAMEILSEVRPDIIILDIMMPKLNGHQVLEFTKTHLDLKNVPVIMLTSVQQQKDIKSTLDMGAFDYIVKPFRPDALIRKVEDLLEASRKTVLVIESDQSIREFLQHIYSEKGFRVIAATNGIEGWKIVREAKPDLLVIDWLLPNMDAHDVIKKVKGDPSVKDTPIIVLAGKDGDAAAYPGIGHFITKPFIPRDLLKRSLALMK